MPIHERYEVRHAVGETPFTGAELALAGGWIRLAEGERPLDAPLVAAYTDALPPALFSRLSEPGLATALRARGWRTFGISENPYVSKLHGFAREFEEFEEMPPR